MCWPFITARGAPLALVVRPLRLRMCCYIDLSAEGNLHVESNLSWRESDWCAKDGRGDAPSRGCKSTRLLPNACPRLRFRGASKALEFELNTSGLAPRYDLGGLNARRWAEYPPTICYANLHVADRPSFLTIAHESRERRSEIRELSETTSISSQGLIRRENHFAGCARVCQLAQRGAEDGDAGWKP